MTQLMGRPILDLSGELSSRSALTDLFAGVRTALLGLAAVAVPVLALWVVTPYADDTATGAARLAGTVWLLGHGAPLTRGGPGLPVTVTPLLLTVLTAGQLYRAGRRAAEPRGAARGPGWGAPAATGAGYLLVAAVIALLCAGAAPGPGAAGAAFRSRALPDVLAVALLVTVALGAGARSVRPEQPERIVPRWAVAGRLPAWAWPPAGLVAPAGAVRRAVLAGAFGLLAGGALLVATAALLDAAVGGRPRPGAGGGAAGVLGLLLLCAVLLPNAVVWGAAYALGPGFTVGTGAVVAPSGAVLGSLPAVPLFALLPEPGDGGWRLLACLLPPLAMAVPAALLGRAAAGRSPAGQGPVGPGGGPGAAWHPGATAAVVLVAALLLGGVAAGCGALSGGALGAGRMAQLGPVPWQAGAAAAGWFAVVGVPGALLVRRRLLRAEEPHGVAPWADGRWAAARTAGRGVLVRTRVLAYGLVVAAGRAGPQWWRE
ncbi:DUF6350 family protein [Kitasatospora sp. NPDC057223]|uniref:cell division protein PerM n=1 Tax=Kitasatospora sp. NPDC057223 TaxID=3346055 RepID=UPI0036378F2E